jgi:hypothetical protein
MASEEDTNVFASPWNSSDMVLVVEDKELHVHKSILTLQSPVFKAMFDGRFVEASQNKITLKEKDFESTQPFLKALYPSSMFGEARVPLRGENLLSILELADEYQCVNLIKQCVDEATITPQNVLQILPYVEKYHQTALPKLLKVINSSASTSKLGKLLPELVNKETSYTTLLAKCHFLESGIVMMQDAIIALICDFLDKADRKAGGKVISAATAYRIQQQCYGKFGGAQQVSTKRPVFSLGFVENTAVDSRCAHAISIREINKTKSCVNCKEKYKEKFIAPITSCQDVEEFFKILLTGDEITTAVKEQKLDNTLN